MTLTFNTHISSLTQLVSGHRLQYFLKNPLFPTEKPVTKFELAVKKVKVNPGSSFVKTMIGRSLRCYIPCFVEIGPLVPKNFKFFFTIYGHGGHLGHVTIIMLIIFYFPVSESLHTTFGI